MEIEIVPFSERLTAQVERFVKSWSASDEHDRFGSAGIGGRTWLTTQLLRGRSAFVATSGTRIVGLLDHVVAEGATHLGIVVDSRYRRLAIGTALVRALLGSAAIVHPIVADCSNQNRAAFALLRRCDFKAIAADGYETTWRHNGKTDGIPRFARDSVSFNQ